MKEYVMFDCPRSYETPDEYGNYGSVNTDDVEETVNEAANQGYEIKFVVPQNNGAILVVMERERRQKV